MFNQPMKDNIFLVGFSGTGKSSVGQELARSIGFAFVDTDARIEAETGRSVPVIFAQDGEEAFRAIERAVLWEICHSDTQVVATGGGVVLDPDNRTHMISSGYVIGLEARVETVYTRMLLDGGKGDAGGRPLLSGGTGGMLARITELKRARAPFYAEADWTIHTDFLTPREVATEIARVMPLVRRRVEGVRGAGSAAPAARMGERRVSLATVLRETGMRPSDVTATPVEAEPLVVTAATGAYPVIIEAGVLPKLGALLLRRLQDKDAGAHGSNAEKLPRIFIISDNALKPTPHIARATAALTAAGFESPVLLSVPGGEGSKSLRMVELLYTQLAAHRAERRDIIIAVGGGVTGDLAGFVAATFLRGLRYVHVPTTLLAMVDSSIGGKTGVNLGATKNLIGAFYPPLMVVGDPDVLATLPIRAFFEGFGEVIKHAVIGGAPRDDESENEVAERAAERFAHLEYMLRRAPQTEAPTAATWLDLWGRPYVAAIIRESAAVKVGVVSGDEREGSAGLRTTLNFGHTLGHALESAFNQDADDQQPMPLLHGEAVALGMVAVCGIALRRGLCDHAFVERLRVLLDAAHLPTRLRAPRPELRDAVMSALSLDKKNESGALRWILPRGIGTTVFAKDVRPDEIAAALDDIGL